MEGDRGGWAGCMTAVEWLSLVTRFTVLVEIVAGMDAVFSDAVFASPY